VNQIAAVQVYWCYTDQRYWLYLRAAIIDNSLIEEVNFIAVSLLNPISVVSILNGSASVMSHRGQMNVQSQQAHEWVTNGRRLYQLRK